MVDSTLLYHGTHGRYAKRIFDEGLHLMCSKPKLDFGPGFYTAVDYNLAVETACVRVGRYNMKVEDKRKQDIPVVLTFDFKEKNIFGLRMLEFPSQSEDWCRFVLANRINTTSIYSDYLHNRDGAYDIVRGPVADSKLSQVVLEIDKRELSLNEVPILVIQPQYGWDDQISFHSMRAISCLECIACDIIESKEGIL